MSGKFKNLLKSLTLSAALTFAGAQAQAKASPVSESFNAATEMKIANQLRTHQIQQLSSTYMQHALKFEKCFLTPYICPTGNITIGIGINVDSMKEFCKLELRNLRMQLLSMEQKKRIITRYPPIANKSLNMVGVLSPPKNNASFPVGLPPLMRNVCIWQNLKS